MKNEEKEEKKVVFHPTYLFEEWAWPGIRDWESLVDEIADEDTGSVVEECWIGHCPTSWLVRCKATEEDEPIPYAGRLTAVSPEEVLATLVEDEEEESEPETDSPWEERNFAFRFGSHDEGLTAISEFEDATLRARLSQRQNELAETEDLVWQYSHSREALLRDIERLAESADDPEVFFSAAASIFEATSKGLEKTATSLEQLGAQLQGSQSEASS